MPRLPKPPPDPAEIDDHLMNMPERVSGMLEERARWIWWGCYLLPPIVLFPALWKWPVMRFLFDDFWTFCALWLGAFLFTYSGLDWLRFRLERREAALRARHGYWRALGPFKR